MWIVLGQIQPIVMVVNGFYMPRINWVVEVLSPSCFYKNNLESGSSVIIIYTQLPYKNVFPFKFPFAHPKNTPKIFGGYFVNSVLYFNNYIM
jgi:hypothetical protein